MIDEYVTVSQVSLRLGVPEHTLRKALRLNLIHTQRAGRTGFFKASELDDIRAALVDANLMPAAPVPVLADPAALPAATIVM